jgi:hypothetical protein
VKGFESFRQHIDWRVNRRIDYGIVVDETGLDKRRYVVLRPGTMP